MLLCWVSICYEEDVCYRTSIWSWIRILFSLHLCVALHTFWTTLRTLSLVIVETVEVVARFWSGSCQKCSTTKWKWRAEGSNQNPHLSDSLVISGEAAAAVLELPQLPAVSLPAQVEDLHQLDPLAQSVSPSTTVNTVNTTTDQDSTAAGMSIMRCKTIVWRVWWFYPTGPSQVWSV